MKISTMLGILTVAFVILKVLGLIDWSWWLVLSPTLIPLALNIILIIVLFVYHFFI